MDKGEISMKYLFGFLFIVISLVCHAAIYQQTDAQGNITYTDEPTGENTKAIHISPSAPPIENKATQQNSTQPAEASIINTIPVHQDYTTFAIITPKDQETFQNPVTIL